MRGPSWHPNDPLIPDDALDAGRVDARRLLRPPHRAASHYPVCSHSHWLGPRWHPKRQHLSQGPDMVSQSSSHRRCLRLPRFGRARSVGGPRLWHGLAYARMREAKIVVDVIQSELLPQAILTLTQRAHPAADCRHMLADAEVEAVT